MVIMMVSWWFLLWPKLGVSNKTVTRSTCLNPSDLTRQPADLTPVTIGSGSRPPEPENGGSIGGFSLQNPKKPD